MKKRLNGRGTELKDYWNYDFSRYTDYMVRNRLDAIIASNYNTTSRIFGYYYRSDFYESIGLKEENAFLGCDRKGKVICAYAKTMEQGLELLASMLKKQGLGQGVIGLEMMDLPTLGLQVLRDNLPGATFVDASLVIHQDIACKTEREVGFIRKAIAASEAGFRSVLSHMRECLGAPRSKLMKPFAPEVARHGAEFLFSNVTGGAWKWREGKIKPSRDPVVYRDILKQLGERFTGYPRNQLSWRYFANKEPVVGKGEPIIFDLICLYQGLNSDISFRAAIGKPDGDFYQKFEKATLIINSLVKNLRVGMTKAEAEEICLDGIKKVVGPWEEYWAVHSTGFRVHEFPQMGSEYIGRFGNYVFETGNVLCVETFGVEQMFMLKKDGMHRLGKMPLKVYCV